MGRIRKSGRVRKKAFASEQQRDDVSGKRSRPGKPRSCTCFPTVLDLNPIEKAVTKLKTLLRKAAE